MTQHATEPNWTAAMRRGDFAQAWRISDDSLRDLQASHQPKHSGERHRQRIWRGETLAGQRVLVRCYHGLGDTLQFIRFIPHLRRLARKVILWVQPELLGLISGVDGIDIALALHDGSPDVDYDVDIEIMELAHALRAEASTITACVPYLHPPSPRTMAPPGGRPRVGLVWEVGDWDKRRSVPPQLLGDGLRDTGAILCSLQQGPGRAAAHVIPAADMAVPDIATLASLITQLDLVITVDTMVAHLAGALGAPVWTLLHADCDWRWPQDGDRSVWYPTMRLFHQTTAEDWQSTVAQVAEALRHHRWP